MRTNCTPRLFRFLLDLVYQSLFQLKKNGADQISRGGWKHLHPNAMVQYDGLILLRGKENSALTGVDACAKITSDAGI